MEFPTYEKMWNSCIKPKIDIMQAEDNDLLFVEGQVKEKIWCTYEDYKNKVHTYMYNPGGLIDRHKVASVMLYSIIANKPFELKYFHNKKEIKVSTTLANEILGFNVALDIVWYFIMEEASQKPDNNRIEIFRNGFVFPECKHEKYPAHVFKMLYYSKLNGCYDIFAFSHVLFLIEAYTEITRKNEQIGKIML
jgi:hypothetical protein